MLEDRHSPVARSGQQDRVRRVQAVLSHQLVDDLLNDRVPGEMQRSDALVVPPRVKLAFLVGFPSFSAIFNRKTQKLPLFSCILARKEGKNRPAGPSTRLPSSTG